MTQATIEIEDGAMPEGWEPERFGFPKGGEMIPIKIGCEMAAVRVQPQEKFDMPRMIIRKKYDPGIDCIPKGWWVWQQGDAKKSWVATPSEGGYGDQVSIYGLQNLIGFTPPEDGQPRQIK